MIKSYKIKKYTKSTIIFCLLGFLAFAILALSVAIMMISDGHIYEKKALFLVISGSFIFSSGLASWIFVQLKKLPFRNISVDDDGLWFSHQIKEHGLVCWNSISMVKEKHLLQCLVLRNSNDQKMLEVLYELDHFDELRLVICEKIFPNKISVKLPMVISKSSLFHPFYLLAIGGIAIFGCYAIFLAEQISGIILIIMAPFLAITEYVYNVYKIELMEKEIILSCAFKKHAIEYSKILSVELIDTMRSGVRNPEVLIHQENAKPIMLHGFPISAVDLYCILRAIGLPPCDEVP